MTEKTEKKPNQHDINRIMIGNQIVILRAMSFIMQNMAGHTGLQEACDLRVRDTKVWWRTHYDEEIGFSHVLGDSPAF